MKIGLIQTGEERDIVIALPIAQWFVERGHQVFWPVAESCAGYLSRAMPQVKFLAVPAGLSPLFEYYDLPLAMLREEGCERIFPLYSQLGNTEIADKRLSFSLKFDEYKYALCGVPFTRKWTLRQCLKRDYAREATLHRSLEIDRDYILVDRAAYGLTLPQQWSDGYRIVDMASMTGNPFDWIGSIEGASKLVLGDGLFAMLAEQVNVPCEKYVVIPHGVSGTPVQVNGWTYLRPGEAI